MGEDSDPGMVRVRTSTGEQIAVPTHKRNWADRVPLVTLLTVVLGAGVLIGQFQALRTRIDLVISTQASDHDRIVRLEALAHVANASTP